jgi:glycosyltransferase involved in cell wall biosynthesis
MPQISIIVTTFNRKHLLYDTIKSILNQTFTDFELLIVDNFSDYDIDGVITLINDPRITLYKNSNYGVIGVNRNYGIERSKGKYLAFCDDDDIWVNNKLEFQYRTIESHDFDLVYSGMLLFETKIDKHIKIPSRHIKTFNDILQSNPIILSSVLVKNDNLVRFPIDEKYITVEDYFLWLLLYNYGFKFGYYDEPLIYYRSFAENYSVKIGASKHLKLFHIYKYIFCNFTIKYSKILLLHLFINNGLKYLLKLTILKNGFKR